MPSPRPALLLFLALLVVEGTMLNEGLVDESKSGEVSSFPFTATSWSAWLWWFLIAYMFKAQATVCDDYFIESIKVVVSRYHIPEDVAGATLMALGCNGPELFTNFISIFITHSDVGIGTIIGSEVFNLLAIIGGSVLVSPQLPLLIHRPAFIRDVTFYMISIVLLAITLWDGRVSLLEALTLLMCAALFATVVAYTRRITAWIDQLKTNVLKKPLLEAASTNSDDDGPFRKALPIQSVTTPSGDGAAILLSEGVYVEGPNVVYLLYRPSTPTSVSQHNRAGLGEEVLPHAASPIAANTEVETSSSYYQQISPTGQERLPPARHEDFVLKPIAYRSGGDTLVEMDGFWSYGREEEEDEDSMITIVVDTETPTERDRLLAELAIVTERAYAGGLKPCLRQICHQLSDDEGGLVWRWLWKAMHITCFPIHLCLAITMGFCDVRDATKRSRWLPEFLLAMLWLAVFSYLMVYSADRITESFGIPSAMMGVTVCAVGTSFPNFYASLIMARAGRSSMAIANALGSNIQNIFVALALPWTLTTILSNPHPFKVSAKGILANVLAMAVTLLVLLVLVAKGRFTLDRTAGYVLIATYTIYLVFAIWQP